MSLIQSLKLVLSPPHRAATPFLAAGAFVGIIGRLTPWRFTRLIGKAGIAFSAFCLYFFRDPKRTPPPGSDLVLASADGRVTSVSLVAPPAALEMGTTPVWRVSTFLSVLDVHINRMPAAGQVTKIAYHAGKFLNASLDKASEHNERNEIRLTLADGRNIGVVQIAGLIARRILCFVEEGEHLEAGERFGLIRFGSRTDVYLPPGVEPIVVEGQTMIGGETVLAKL
ncbi:MULTISPECIES: phosphatidylserine decarboxylase [Gluconobacter]|uniref:Phosphatidylserine decarboxylase proenzyme n=1 Tax=Gluconobacter cerinus TaxID=38307 RepID=A0A1B6VID5_9PROT|nr:MULTISPECIES: phosphatidylserine decarboxylase [Gluconobacter]MBS1031560.1 phosphatidylserine decarboxylase [Gluconobacter cerinus]MBS1034694.1 phosphatidylserine decarboxylase [Gluconobacter cerinus]MBS1068686.1 phosphatidylserine decarboxylase [Gluconobacter cerinus]OAJ66979.1 phosphatidylserine decarboxylase [Gluconobacter cerinus]GFE96795.1 phosphatidylserine decarboxylase proenzyme [Gluconobacter sp. Gdi]